MIKVDCGAFIPIKQSSGNQADSASYFCSMFRKYIDFGKRNIVVFAAKACRLPKHLKPLGNPNVKHN
jgi:hypothetical protein